MWYPVVILVSGDLGKSAVLKDLCGAETITKPYDADNVLVKAQTAIDRHQPKCFAHTRDSHLTA